MMIRKSRHSRALSVKSLGLPIKLIILAVMLSSLPMRMAQAVDIEVYVVHFELRPGTADWMWGLVDPDASVEVKKGEAILFEITADSSGDWENPFSVEINPGDVFTVTAGAGLNPVTLQIPDPLTAEASSTTNTVWGQIDHLDHELVEVLGNWSSGFQSVTTDGDGHYSATYAELPNGGDGIVTYYSLVNYANVYYSKHFRTLDLILEVNYTHDWVQSHYEPGHTVWLTLYEGDGATVKATAEVVTGEIPWWGGGTGFSTDQGDPWLPERPDILPGDWVYGEMDNGYQAWVRVGRITGEVDLDLDEVSGSIDSGWLTPAAVPVECFVWEELSPDSKVDSVIPNGADTYTCSWSGEWDLQPNVQIAVSYRDPGGYQDPDAGQVQEGHRIYDVYFGYTDEIVMKIHSGYDWVEGLYAPGHSIHLIITESDGVTVKATTTLITAVIDGWGGRSGFATYLPETEWEPKRPDLRPGDIIYGEVGDGSEFSDAVKLGWITGQVDISADLIRGTVAAEVDWPPDALASRTPGAVDVVCSIWEEPGPENKFDSVMPDGADHYECGWSGEWDILKGQPIQVAYFEPEGHEIIKNFNEIKLIFLPLILR